MRATACLERHRQAQVVEARFKLNSATIVDAPDRHGHLGEDVRKAALRT
jgi:hypothetical protein